MDMAGGGVLAVCCFYFFFEFGFDIRLDNGLNEYISFVTYLVGILKD
jgi:hypothetical protein